MNQIHDGAYYHKMYDALMEKYRGFPDLEWDMKMALLKYDKPSLTDARRQELIRVQALNVAESYENWLRDEKRRLCIARSRKILVKRDTQERFEFMCYCLSRFKKKYGIA